MVLLCCCAGSLLTAQDPEEAIDTTVCDLIQHALDFDNRHVRVRGIVQEGLEFLGISAEECRYESDRGRNIWLSTSGDDDVVQYYRGWTLQRFMQALQSKEFKGGDPQVSWQVPLPVSALDQGQLRRLGKELKHRQSVQALIIGRFTFIGDGLLEKSRNGNYSFRGATGHLGCCSSQIVLEAIQVAMSRFPLIGDGDR
jgi:hypothetical protein